MAKSLANLFQSLGETKSLDSLFSRIILVIDQQELRRTKIRVVVSRLVGGLSFVSLFPILVDTFKQLQTSGFLNYFSLLFTDSGAMLTLWREFTLSLVETLPVFQFVLIGLALFALFISVRFATKEPKLIYEF